MRAALPRSNRPRRGVTLVEMLVVVALVVLMMTILVQIFQAAAGAMTASRVIQDLDVSLRQVNLRLRQDLAGVTARMTPPLDPTLKLGYFEYAENAFADAQGEDTDDYLAFTTKAPEGQVFTGRAFIAKNAGNAAVQPVTVTSQLAEVIYFLRNGNLYRRVFLIVPERQGSIAPSAGNSFPALSPATKVSWLAVNEFSARPSPTGDNNQNPQLNDLGDLTNRENRAFRPRFRSDFFDRAMGTTPDGVEDDLNGDDIPDFYPTLYPNVFNNRGVLINEDIARFPNKNPRSELAASYDVHAFPYIFPGMFSRPETTPSSEGYGWIHSLDPSGNTLNHAPLGNRDNITSPDLTAAGAKQTWWGFPTWRETLAANWRDPLNGVDYGTRQQQNGLRPFPPNRTPAATIAADTTYASNLLPPVPTQYGTDLAGSAAFLVNIPGVWDDDLVLSNVRSFDVKAFDHDAPLYNFDHDATPSIITTVPPLGSGYHDLGYGAQKNRDLLSTTSAAFWDANRNPKGFGHAGRIPPLTTDNRVNPSRPFLANGTFNNVGDDAATVIRLTRVWDTWSTDYTNAPSVDVNLNGHPSSTTQANPVYPSYPPPYAAPLRGIQIQIRVADPRDERVKVLTIRQDFTDKL